MTKRDAENRRYNGWTNYATWNVALWIGNDEGLYHLARDIAQRYCPADESPYERFRDDLRDLGIIETPDRISYSDSALDIDALDELMREL